MSKFKPTKITLFLLITNLVLIGYISIIKIKTNVPLYTSSNIFEKIVQIKDISLVQYNYTGIISFKNNLTFGDVSLPLTSKHFLIKYNGYVKAGIDMNGVKIDVYKDKVEITLPEPKIIDVYIDEKSIEVYDQSMNILNPLKIEDYNNAIIEEKKKIEKDALEKGILDQVNKQADLFLRNMLKDMGFKNIIIK
ncbi:DUF4230 domain-containing protein [Thermobrachium celere]|nr:DUF4230 domain-containing protein [Thermobrachium celere]